MPWPQLRSGFLPMAAASAQFPKLITQYVLHTDNAMATDMLDAPLVFAFMVLFAFIAWPGYCILALVIVPTAVATLVAINGGGRTTVAERAHALEQARAHDGSHQ